MPNYTPYTLLDPDAAIPFLAATINASQELRLEVHEDKCFAPEKWLEVGKIKLHPAIDDDVDSATSAAIHHGSFTWAVPTFDILSERLADCLGESELKADLADKVNLVLREGLQDIVRRLLLLLPTFDPALVANLPFRFPTTLVVDTSAVKQGALDFACNFLYPMARIKVPAVVPVEILNMTDRFLHLRRRKVPQPKHKVGCLAEHISSQGTQRSLLRLEWHSEIQVERPLSGPDPLRAIFKPDAEFNEDNMHSVHRSLADRLIFESAREHKTQLSPDHNICVLTSDQGLARMVLAEGMSAVYFDARKSGGPLGKTLTGCRFHPLTAKLYTVSLTKVLWELATCFGSVRLACDEGQFQITAMSEELSWFPYQSRDDLLWCRWSVKQQSIVPVSTVMPDPIMDDEVLTENLEDRGGRNSEDFQARSSEQFVAPSRLTRGRDTLTTPIDPKTRVGAYVFSPSKLLRFVVHLARNREMPIDRVQQLLDVSSIKEYVRFLRSGEYITSQGDKVIMEAPLAGMADAITEVNLDDLAQHLKRFPSFLAYINLITEHQRNPAWDPADFMRNGAATPYRVLGEISGMCVSIPGKGIIVTSTNPQLEAFGNRALSIYNEMAIEDQWVLTGAWLEQLALKESIHPVRTRQLLDEAIEARLLRRYTEGSTIETRFEDHKLSALTSDESGEPQIIDYRLYQGDFLSSGRASVRIQLERESS